MKNVYRRSIRVSLGLITAALPLAVQAQDSDEEVFELSPFSVDAEGDIGYRATSTLAGTRLNTPLKDLGSAITVLTDELFDDTGATDAATILSYATSSEVGGVNGNFAGNQFGNSRPGLTNQRINPQGGQRIRGLSAASLTRNYFLTDIAFDSYNSTRVTMNRGPNSLLFGVGNPGGVINNGIRGALIGRDFGEISIRLGEHSSHRETFDYNKELIEGRLAVRLSGLHDDTQYQQRPAFEIDKRFTTAVEAVLFRNEESNFLGRTSLRGNYESGDIHGTPPSVIPPTDVLSEWFTRPDIDALEGIMGTTFPDWTRTYQPKFSFDDRDVNNSQFYNNAPTWGLVQKQVALVYPQHDAQAPSVGLTDSSIEGLMARMEFNRATEGPNAGRPMFNMFRTESFLFAPFITGFTVPVIMDRNIFDNENNMMGGTTNRASQDFDATNIVLEQILLGGDAGIEIAYDQQHHEREWSLPFTQAGRQHGADVVFDISEYVGTGEPNPNFGRPVIIDESFGSFDQSQTDREAYRATGFYSFDFADKSDNLKWLGRHTFTGFYSDQKIDGLSRDYNTGWISDRTDIAADTHPSLNSFFRRAITAVYVGDSQLNAQSVSDVRISPVSVPVAKDGDVHKVLYYDLAAGEALVANDYTVREYLNGGNRNRQQIESEVFSWQSYFLNDHVVGLAGWRKDTATAFGRPNGGRLPNATFDEDFLVLKPDSDSETSGNTFTWSLVGHVPFELPGGTELSVHYGESENFSPAGIRRNAYHEVLAPPSGATKEYGFSLGLLDNKLSLKFNWFETDSSGADAGLGGAVNTATGTVGRWLFGWTGYENQGRPIEEAVEFSGGPEAIGYWNSYDEAYAEIIGLVPDDLQEVRNFRVVDGVLESDPGGGSASTDFVAEGFEFEMVGNITPSWRVFMNVAKQEAIQDNTGPALKEIVAGYQANLDASPIRNWRDDPVNGEGFTFQSRFDLRATTPLAAALAKDGTLNQELRKWRGNLITTYTFNEGGPLKGFWAGGGLRYQDSVATGYPLIRSAEGVLVPDVARPFLGPEEINGDLWVGYKRKLSDKVDWKIQLNVRNAFGDSDPITVVTNPDGNVAVIRNPNPKEAFLTNTFSF